MRKDFCSFLLILFPCLREYGNISYNFAGIISSPARNSNQQENQQIHEQNERTNLTSIQMANNLDYDTADYSGNTPKLSKSFGKKFNKKAITQQPVSVIIPNILRLDTPD